MSKSDKLMAFLKNVFIILLGMIVLMTLFLLFAPRAERVFVFEKNPVVPEPKITTLLFAGDIMLSRNVHGAMTKSNSYTLPFQGIAEEIRSADIAFANLESPFLNKPPYGQQGLVFKAAPEAIEGLKFAGFDILATANNHAYDQGKIGIQYTYDWLKQNGIIPIGTTPDCHDGKIIEKNGIKFGFLAYSYAAFNDGGRVPDAMVCDWNNQAQVAADIADLKARSDFVIVSPHMGTEYQREPDEANAKLARAAVDAGADLIIGHHPHWIQITENYKGKWIFYSLGNFVFDQMWSQDTREGLVVKIAFSDKELEKIDLMPMVIDNYCCPRWADGQEKTAILRKINLTSPVLVDKN
jgi:poly-gamma-glutamate capsule biosynthesis protein CapA/YwtB (metallophosphatase superfamily)